MTERSTISAAITDPYEVLRALAPFKLFTDSELQEIIPLCEIKTFEPEVTIIHETDPSDNRVYFLLTGGVSVYVAENFILALKRTGDIFGEMSMVDDKPRNATITAREDTMVREIPRDSFFESFHQRGRLDDGVVDLPLISAVRSHVSCQWRCVMNPSTPHRTIVGTATPLVCLQATCWGRLRSEARLGCHERLPLLEARGQALRPVLKGSATLHIL